MIAFLKIVLRLKMIAIFIIIRLQIAQCPSTNIVEFDPIFESPCSQKSCIRMIWQSLHSQLILQLYFIIKKRKFPGKFGKNVIFGVIRGIRNILNFPKVDISNHVCHKIPQVVTHLFCFSLIWFLRGT